VFGEDDADNERLLNRCIVQYHFTENEHEVLVRPHGNSKTSEPFVRTLPSTFADLNEVASSTTPKPAVHMISSQCGGVVGASSAGSLPRNERQVKDMRKRKKITSGTLDPLHSVMMMCKDTMKDFVRAVTGAPDYMIVIALDRMLDNLVRFCVSSESSLQPTILTFDPTFSLGEFDVTVSTYKHPLVVFRNPCGHTAKHPSLIGPVLIHQRKQFVNYHYLTSTLVSFRPELRNLHVFGTDGEQALVQACQSQFPGAIHLRCWLHFKDNLLNKLERDLRLPRCVSQEFISDIMGNASKLEHGLVDAEDEEIFTVRLHSLEDVWNQRESNVTNEKALFYDWFLEYHASTVKDTMLSSIRQLAGLGNPPSPYYTNTVESMNCVLKRRTDFKKQEVTAFIHKLRELVDNQFAEIDRAVAGIGDYKVHEDYKKFSFTSAKWFSMSEDQRQRALKRFQSVLPANKDNSLLDVDMGESSHSSNASGTLQDNPLAVLGISRYIADTVWQRATALLQQDSNFALAPGNNGNAWLVTRSTNGENGKPYFVQNHKGHYECEADCIYYHSTKVCAHVVAVALKNNDLDKVIAWHSKQNHHVNTTQLAQSGLPMSSVGKKRVSRKGVTKQKSAKIKKMCAESDESSWKLRPAMISSTATSVQNQLSMSVNIHPASSSVVVPSQMTTFPSQIAPSQISLQSPGFMPHLQSSSQISSQSPEFMPHSQQSSTQLYSQSPGFMPPSQYSQMTPSQISPQLPGFMPTQSSTQSLGQIPGSMSPVFPAPMSPFNLIMLHGNISVCSGCHQKFPRKSTGEYADPPYNLAVQHNEPRTYHSPITGMPTSKIGNAYYHVYLPCLQSKWPMVSGSNINIPFELRAVLQSEHKVLLFRNLGITL